MVNQLKKLLPGSFKDFLLKSLRSQLKRHWEQYDQDITYVKLGEKHIQHLIPVTTREALLNKLPKNGLVAELGVDHGDFSQKILEQCSPEKLHLVDIWGSERYHHGLKKVVEEKFQADIESGRVQIHHGLSTERVNDFENDYFDLVYIDTDHSYETTLAELRSYGPKVKKDGFMAGHDFTLGNWNGMVRYGVIEAVYQYCVEENWELRYLTFENREPASFAIRRIST